MGTNRNIKIYLAGAMQNCKSFAEMNQWRKRLKGSLEKCGSYYSVNLTVINPVEFYNFEEKKHQNNREVMQFDLTHVKSSDIIIVNLQGLNTSIGTCIELYEAYKKEIPVIAFGSNDIYQNLHPWIKEYITRVEKSEDYVVSYIRDFYFAY